MQALNKGKPQPDTLKIIDGSQGEGGGQILRSALALSMCTGTPIRIENIRAGRKKPGLLRQHLTCVLASQAVCGARVEGAVLGSTHLVFEPGMIRHGNYPNAQKCCQSGKIPVTLQQPTDCHQPQKNDENNSKKKAN